MTRIICEMDILIGPRIVRPALQGHRRWPYTAPRTSLTSAPTSALHLAPTQPDRGCMAGLTTPPSGAYELGRGLVKWRGPEFFLGVIRRREV